MAKRKTSRYEVANGEWNGKTERYIARAPSDLSAENRNRFYVIRGFQVDRKELDNPAHTQNTVYLDGACQGPYQDVPRHIFSLDHHEGCYRSITIASCEQALRLTRKKVIGAAGFNIVANDPDPDTVLAAWQILHADRMAFDKRFFKRIRPIVNLEGNIDSHGFGHEEFMDMSQESLDEHRRRIDWVFAEERELKAKGQWEKADLVDHVRRTFAKLDELVLFDEQMAESVRIDALDEIPLSDDKSFIFVVSSSGNAYDVEKEILRRERRKKKNKRRCVCMLFHDGRIKFTLKLLDFVSEYKCKPIFDRLNKKETDVKISNGVQDQRFLKNGWGGSDGVGGPPRYPNGAGTFLGLNTIKTEVAEELKEQTAQIQALQKQEELNRLAKHTESNGSK